ncbi:MAG: hypothetical protein JNK45_26680 [Myxococcales bacterium]|nr:hypothetical protein [Myxococcales bacterium]
MLAEVEAQVVDPVLSPGEVKCIVAFTPEADLRAPLTIQWTVSVSLAPSPDERDDPIAVLIDVTDVGDGSPRRTRG